jgi:hypothetical protein
MCVPMAVNTTPMGMDRETECLDCGSTRLAPMAPRGETGEWPDRGGLGWESSTDLSETERSWYRRAALYVHDDETAIVTTREDVATRVREDSSSNDGVDGFPS